VSARDAAGGRSEGVVEAFGQHEAFGPNLGLVCAAADPASREVVYPMFGRAKPISYDRDPAAPDTANAKEAVARSKPNLVGPAVGPTVELTRCFLHLANLPNFALDRLSRYEATLWRQARQILIALDALDRRKPQERRRRFHLDDRSFEHDC
jgi:hypothetical protein